MIIKILQFLIIIFFIVNCTTSYIVAQEITLTAELVSDTIIEGETAYLLLTLTNNSKSRYLYDRFYLEGTVLNLNLKDQKSGYIYHYRGGHFDYMGDPEKSILEQGEFTQLNVNLNLNAYCPTNTKGNLPPGPFISMVMVGEYEIFVTYIQGKDTIKSNIVHLSVNEPPLKEQEAYEEIKKICLTFYDQKATPELVDAFNHFIEKHKKSKYIPFAKFYLGDSYHRLKKNDDANRTKLHIINEYPNTGYALSAMDELYISKEAKISALKEIIQKHVETRSAKYASYLLKRAMKF